uniref:Reverse transcriptase zinc-binding domain-containing protein n=1 Tax=Cannabis sativa TaxID=3483 RepID=A0A803PTB6_CANSA
MMIMPKKILKSIEAICRAFLWKGRAAFHWAGAVAWDDVCQQKKDGGLGIKRSEEWNKAAMCKYIWVIANKQESLWLRWVHSVYIKREEWWGYSASIHSIWYWKKLVALEDNLKTIQDPAIFQEQKYHISAGYTLFKPSPNRVSWSHEVWARLNIPKHSVILWLAMLNRLKTKERLMKFRIQVEECSKSWLGWRTSASDLPQIIRWIGRTKVSRFRKNVLAAVVAGLVYIIWEALNKIIWQEEQPEWGRLIENLKWRLKSQIIIFLPKKLSCKDREWFYDL